jgi:hypothetical protein
LEIKKTLTGPITTKKNIFRVPGVPANNKLIPVIYQAAIDSWKNFVREVHCHKVNEDEYEVTILFENEHLRKHAPLDLIYRLYRYLRYGHVTDIESFRIILKEGLPAKFRFEGIYSNEHGIHYDNIHGDIPVNGKVLPVLGAGIAGVNISPLVSVITIVRHIAFGIVLGLMVKGSN